MWIFRRRHDASAYPEIVDDREHLVDDGVVYESGPRRAASFCLAHKRFLFFLTVLAGIITGHVIAIYYLYIRCNPHDCVPIKVMTLNCWGMPESLGSQFKAERIKGIAAEVNKAEYDLYLLEELWMETDYYIIRASVPNGYNMTEFRQLALPTCDGRIAPTACSGLSIISKFPLLEVEFNSYTEHGDWKKATIDGEWFARKGVGRVRIEPRAGISVDVFVTHTAADPDPKYHNYTNEYYRNAQVKELMESYITKSSADLVLLAGDFNAGPEKHEGKPYAMVRAHMDNSIEEFFYKLNEWLDAKYATYGNLENTFSGIIYDPIIYDYIFYRTNTKKARLFTNWFELPFFKLKIFHNALQSDPSGNRTLDDEAFVANATDVSVIDPTSLNESPTLTSRTKRDVESDFKVISFSDHEAVTSTIYLRFTESDKWK